MRQTEQTMCGVANSGNTAQRCIQIIVQCSVIGICVCLQSNDSALCLSALHWDSIDTYTETDWKCRDAVTCTCTSMPPSGQGQGGLPPVLELVLGEYVS